MTFIFDDLVITVIGSYLGHNEIPALIMLCESRDDKEYVSLFGDKFIDHMYYKHSDVTKLDISLIMYSAKYSFMYALATKKRFPQGEPAIICRPEYSTEYAIRIIGGRWIECENDSLCASAKHAYNYLLLLKNTEDLDDFIGNPLYEVMIKTISKSAKYSLAYSIMICNGRFILGEESISKSLKRAYTYASLVIKGKFPECEELMATSLEYSHKYAVCVLRSRFCPGENLLKNSYMLWKDYQQRVGFRLS